MWPIPNQHLSWFASVIEKTHYVNMYRYTKIVQNMTTSKLMNAFKIGAGVLSKDTRLLPCVWNDNWSIDHSMFCVFSPSSLSHPLPSSKQERFQQNCQFSARRINDPQKHRKDARNEKDEGGKEYLRHLCSILRAFLGPLYKRSTVFYFLEVLCSHLSIFLVEHSWSKWSLIKILLCCTTSQL